ncbi:MULTISPECIES: sulfurtransferase TusA family protein [Peribacillus]|uniref:sulfurtransferase TusA family protein n=1 Tax=Peribacillus TaxID=2675229 RepID=UPI001F4EF8E8|nr:MULTISPECIES: sulfurtransferase TusA family protein [unclassified Peribacillus]MCK1983516.1 sulfurtransferase TusA family protein [Peribacillus sp. Aquil_B1]MCK2006534.1 sulfurtransferase TusA family protein [Peribacillus sp. Aquil_B8]
MIKTNSVLDAKGLACPMPIVKTKKAMNGLEAGEVLEIQATDKGSTADMKAWAESSGHQYLGTVEEGTTLKHYLRKAIGDETAVKKHEKIISNEELHQLMQKNSNMIILDVREAAEYAFHHIPAAKSLPMGELEQRMDELDKESEIFVICRSGSRSDLAAQKLTAAGFEQVFNVVPGMSQWNGPSQKSLNE